jgi:hypothetical protein
VTRQIAIMVEGATEMAFRPTLTKFLAVRLQPIERPRLRFVPMDGRIPKGDLLRREVERLLVGHDAVIALTDVYTDSDPRDFLTATDAIARMRGWVDNNPRFHPHAAQYEFEAWLLPFWPQVRKLTGTTLQSPSMTPESVNHNKPPSAYLKEAYRTSKKRAYRKVEDAVAILRNQDLANSANACPELKAFLNTILTLSGGSPLYPHGHRLHPRRRRALRARPRLVGLTAGLAFRATEISSGRRLPQPTPDSTTPSARFIRPARSRRRVVSGGASSTGGGPFPTNSLSLRANSGAAASA